METNRKQFIKITGLGLGGFLFNALEAKNFQKNTLTSDFEIEKDVLFFNNATLGLSPKAVSAAIIDRMKIVDSTGNYGGLDLKTLSKIAGFVNVKASEIALTHNVTEGINIAAWGTSLKKGDEVLMTGHEHVGGVLPWLNRQKIDKISVKTFELKRSAAETLDALQKAITNKTKVIAVPHIPCTIGSVLPIKEICQLAKKRGIVTVIDGAHPLGMMPLDLKDLGCDIYTSCFHKWMCGPKGTGMLYVSEEMQDRVVPNFVGGYSADWEITQNSMALNSYTNNAHRYFYGTQNSANYAGINAAIDFQEKIGREEVWKHGLTLADYFKSFIKDSPQYFELLSPEENISSSSIVSFMTKKGGKLLADDLRKKNIITRFVPKSNLNCNRVSFHLYNTKEQVEILIKEIENFA